MEKKEKEGRQDQDDSSRNVFLVYISVFEKCIYVFICTHAYIYIYFSIFWGMYRVNLMFPFQDVILLFFLIILNEMVCYIM